MPAAASKDKMEFAFLMAKHSTATLHDLQRLLRYCATYSRLMTDACNVPNLGPDYMRKVERTQKAIRKIVASFDATAKMSGDPRGATVKIRVPDGFTNDWGQEGICVPTS